MSELRGLQGHGKGVGLYPKQQSREGSWAIARSSGEQFTFEVWPVGQQNHNPILKGRMENWIRPEDRILASNNEDKGLEYTRIEPCGSDGKESASSSGDPSFHPWIRKIPWRKE